MTPSMDDTERLAAKYPDFELERRYKVQWRRSMRDAAIQSQQRRQMMGWVQQRQEQAEEKEHGHEEAAISGVT
ncbi:hypothetical protein VTI74DRAFT_2177 [Chaetomium olivicolor]